MDRIPASVVEQLGYYVYGYVRRGSIDYVGKGVGQRALAHLARLPGRRVDLLAFGLPNEKAAFSVEAALIQALGLDHLTNKVSGQGTKREPLREALLRLGARRVRIVEPSVLIRVSQLFRPGMRQAELYEITRGVWKVGRRRNGVALAMAVHNGVIREVYRVREWYPAGTTSYRFRRQLKVPDRWEFVGSVARRAVRLRYVGKSVAYLLPQGAQNPIRYAGGA